MPIALIAVATILGIEIISRRYNKRSQGKHQKRLAFDKMMASADNEQARADIEARRRKLEEKKGRGKDGSKWKSGGAGGVRERVKRARRIIGSKGKEWRTKSSRLLGSDGFEVVDVSPEWDERYKMKIDSWDFGGSGEW